eukprot:6406855-Lingulodinium_polyedra.AAC.1
MRLSRDTRATQRSYARRMSFSVQRVVFVVVQGAGWEFARRPDARAAARAPRGGVPVARRAQRNSFWHS